MLEKKRDFSVFLRTECDGETERIFAKAQKAEKGFIFEKDGTDYCICYCKKPPFLRIERLGEISYALEFNPEQETHSILSTSMGNLSVSVRVEKLFFGMRQGSECVECEYVLDFSGFEQRHKLSFAVKQIL